MSNEEQFDFFISYTKSDEPWAEWVAWQLEEEAKPPYRAFLQAWDFHAGGDFVHEMQKATTKASRTIAVLSPSFLQGKFTQSEWQAAFAKDPTGELGLLVPVRVAECTPEGLLRARIYIDLIGLDEQQARAKLLKSISGERVKPDVAPQFPTNSANRSEPRFPGPSSEQLISAPPLHLAVPETHTTSSQPGSGSAGLDPPGHKHSFLKYWIVGIVALLIIAALVGYMDIIPWRPKDPMLGSFAGEAREFSDLKMTMLWCPPGTFKMGSPASDEDANPDEKPQVDVTLSHGFWLGQTEVTQGQWEQLMGTTPWKGQKYVKEGANCPAVYLSHGLLVDGTLEPDSAMAFCRKLTASERAAGRLADGWEYTLPTEAQWEYACRAETTSKYSFGDDAIQLGNYAWYGDVTVAFGEGNAEPVGLKRANPWGFHDMHGNVFEWSLDGYTEKLPGGRDPYAHFGSIRVVRGGSWSNPAGFARSALRGWEYPSSRTGALGFRLALIPLRQRAERPAR